MPPPSRPPSGVVSAEPDEPEGSGVVLPSVRSPGFSGEAGGAGASVLGEPVSGVVASERPVSVPVPGGRGRRDWSGATSSSMASKTELTSSRTSVSWTGSRSRRLLQVSRWEREKVSRVWMGPIAPSRW